MAVPRWVWLLLLQLSASFTCRPCSSFEVLLLLLPGLGHNHCQRFFDAHNIRNTLQFVREVFACEVNSGFIPHHMLGKLSTAQCAPFGRRLAHAVRALPDFHALPMNTLASDVCPFPRRCHRTIRENRLTTLEAGAFNGAASLEVL